MICGGVLGDNGESGDATTIEMLIVVVGEAVVVDDVMFVRIRMQYPNPNPNTTSGAHKILLHHLLRCSIYCYSPEKEAVGSIPDTPPLAGGRVASAGPAADLRQSCIRDAAKEIRRVGRKPGKRNG